LDIWVEDHVERLGGNRVDLLVFSDADAGEERLVREPTVLV